MKKLAARARWLPMAGLAVLLASMLAFLYVRTRGHDASSYFENVALLRQLKQLDARWELDVLKSKMGINPNYDSLVDPLVELNQLLENLQTVVTRQQHAAASTLADGSEAFHRVIQQKTRLVEHFKSHNSVLRNSLAFLPTAADDVLKAGSRWASGRRSGTLRQISTGVNQVLLDSMVYSQTPADTKAAQIQAELDLLTVDRGDLPQAVRANLDIFAAHVRTVLREQPVVNGLLSSIAAVPAAARIDDIDNLLSSEQRSVELHAQQSRLYLQVFAVALAGLLLYAAIALLRNRAVIKRINVDLRQANEGLEQRVQERTQELHEAQSELMTTARQAGMAEIANNVLHNVGNVLNSLNVSAGLINNMMRDSRSQGLAKAVQMINERAADLDDFLTRDEKGKLLPGYLNKAVAALALEQQSVVHELGLLTKSVDHIKDIVATQQSYAGATSVTEAVQVTDLLEDALRINAGSMTRDQVTVVRDFAEIPLLLLDKHLVLQILVNLIRNARQAMDGVLDRSHQITLRMNLADAADGRRLQIRVEDDGQGIVPENLKRLFVHGFTTRKNGHGFGLHSCALAAREMGGTLTAASEGPDKGAVFTLELLANPVEVMA